MPRSYAAQATRSTFLARASSSGDEGLRNCATVGLDWAASGAASRVRHVAAMADVVERRRGIDDLQRGSEALLTWLTLMAGATFMERHAGPRAASRTSARLSCELLRGHRPRPPLFPRQAIDGWSGDATHAQHQVELPAMMCLVLDHRAKPFPDGDWRVRRRSTLLAEPTIGERGEERTRFVVQPIVVGEGRCEAVGEVGAMPRIRARATMDSLRIHEPLDRREMPNEIAERELARRRRPLEIAR